MNLSLFALNQFGVRVDGMNEMASMTAKDKRAACPRAEMFSFPPHQPRLCIHFYLGLFTFSFSLFSPASLTEVLRFLPSFFFSSGLHAVR